MFDWISYPIVLFPSGVATGPLVSMPVARSIVLIVLAACCGLIWFVHGLAKPRRAEAREARIEKQAA